MKRFLLLSAALLFCASALAGGLPRNTVVRIEGSGIEGGWHEGKITTTMEGCTMVALDKATRDGYTLIALIATARLERKIGNTWSDVPLRQLLAQEPKQCLQEGSD